MLVPFCGSHILVGSERLPEWYAEKIVIGHVLSVAENNYGPWPLLVKLHPEPKRAMQETVERRRSIPYKKRFDWLFRSTYIPLRAPEFHGLPWNYTEQRHAISKKKSDTYWPYLLSSFTPLPLAPSVANAAHKFPQSPVAQITRRLKLIGAIRSQHCCTCNGRKTESSLFSCTWVNSISASRGFNNKETTILHIHQRSCEPKLWAPVASSCVGLAHLQYLQMHVLLTPPCKFQL